ncbi:MAG: hypothetical protein RLZZ546_225 [Bacteroidota bacterium]
MQQALLISFLITNLFLINHNLFSQDHQDCDQPFLICKKQTYHFSSMIGYGKTFDILGPLKCSEELVETNTKWLSWDVSQSGILTFFIDPIDPSDDIDFV